MNRRNFLKYSTAAGGALALSQLPSLAKGTKLADHFFVQITVLGGWDVSLSLDPWLASQRPEETDYFIEYRPDELISSNGVFFLGPAMEPLKAYINDLCVVNGVFMSSVDNGHEASSSYIRTGSPSGMNPEVSVEINQSIPDGPFGVLTNTFVQTKPRAQVISTVDEIKNLVNIANPTERAKTILQTLLRPTDFSLALQATVQSAKIMDKLVASLKSIIETGIVPDSINVSAASLASGACATAHLELIPQLNLDTHSNHVGTHLDNQKRLWAELARLIKTFKDTAWGNQGESLFDRTTFYVCSEFIRTPALNASKGKDHNPYTNSVLMFGRGIRGGQAIGASKNIGRAISPLPIPYQVSVPFDFSIGQAVDSRTNTEILFPENVVRTLAEAVKVDWGVFHSVSKETKILAKALT